MAAIVRWLAAALLGTALVGCEASVLREPRHSGAEARGVIERVVDGDTISVRLKPAMPVVVRLLAVDSPEKYETRYGVPNECGSAAASGFMGAFRGSAVRLASDPSQPDRDRFGRLLRYVELASGTDLGAAEIRAGLAVPFAVNGEPRRLARYEELAQHAATAVRGSWGPPCYGDFHSSLAGIR